MDIYAVIGAGGFGREVMPLAARALNARLPKGEFQLIFVAEEPATREVNGYPVWSLDEFLARGAENKFYNIAIGDSQVRERLAARLVGCEAFSITAASHVNLAENVIGEGAIFTDFTMVTANAKIGKHFHANIYSYVAHDCVVGDFVTFAPGVKCNGGVIVEDHAYIGTGAVIKQSSASQKIVIGRGAVVGMGSVVTKSVDPYTLVFGSPAKFVKSLKNSDGA